MVFLLVAIVDRSEYYDSQTYFYAYFQPFAERFKFKNQTDCHGRGINPNPWVGLPCIINMPDDSVESIHTNFRSSAIPRPTRHEVIAMSLSKFESCTCTFQRFRYFSSPYCSRVFGVSMQNHDTQYSPR